MTARALCLLLVVIVVAIVVTTPVSAQVPYVQVYSDPELSDPVLHCSSVGTLLELYVVLHNANMIVGAVDFSIDYPTYYVFWAYDKLPYDWMVNNEVVTIGDSPSGIAIAWGAPWMEDGTQGPIVLLRPQVVWSRTCDCDDWNNYTTLHVGGYGPLGKTHPSMVRYPDFMEFPALGGWSEVCHAAVATEPTTWGRVKALYRN